MCEVECMLLFFCISHWEHAGIPSPAMRFTSW